MGNPRHTLQDPVTVGKIETAVSTTDSGGRTYVKTDRQLTNG